MDGLQKITALYGPLSSSQPAKPDPVAQQPVVPAAPHTSNSSPDGRPCPAARSLDEVFGNTIALLKDLSRASMNLAQATEQAARRKGLALQESPRPDKPPRQVDTLA